MSFHNAGQKPGIEIWRIENLEPVPWTDIGKFCTGDSYIVLKTNVKPGQKSYQWDIHFWLGSETSQDEAGVAAYKTVELDDSLGGAPVQHREVQGHESELFLSYFKGGIEYVAGGVASGFSKVERDVYETRLLHLKGNRSVRVRPVPVSASSLNSGDVFVLDAGLTIYQWNGSSANRKEKAKGLDVTRNIKDNERGGRAKVYVVDEGTETADFWETLGGKGPVGSASSGGDDEKFEKLSLSDIQLFRVSDASGSLQTDLVANGPLKKAQLETNDVFIVDSGDDIFVWVGKGANAQERKQGIVYAQQYAASAGKPNAKITKVVEGGETPIFKEQFESWEEFRLPTFGAAPKAPERPKKEIDYDALVNATNPADTLVDDGSGHLQLYRVEKFDKALVDKKLTGRFFAGDSYIVHYSFKRGSKEEHIIYFWLGRNSSQDEIGSAALLTVKLDDELGGAATQVRVTQGKEPSHFLSLFKGEMIVYSGGNASSFKNVKEEDPAEPSNVRLFHIKGTNPINTRAVQVETTAASLNSGDCFLLQTHENVFLWQGSGSNEEERNCAAKIANKLKNETNSGNVDVIDEGSESDDFWQLLGGKAEYATSKALSDAPTDPRLFQISNATGNLNVEEVHNFAQDDLDNNDVFLLDVGTELYVWIGSEANRTETESAREVASKYLTKSNRDSATPVVFVHAGSEPPMFTSAFLGWDSTAASSFEDPYEKKLRLVAEAKAKESGGTVQAAASSAASAPAPAAAASSAAVSIPPGSQFFPLADLQNKTVEGIDSTCREQYLSDSDFSALFRMNKEEFAKLKGWRQAELKKQHKLF